MNKELPSIFLERLKAIVGEGRYRDVLAGFSRPEILSVRVNTLKTTRSRILARLKELNISFKEVLWSAEALTLEGISREELGRMDLINDGSLYRQSFSSMLPVLALAPQPGERILDMCAAPGSKTTQIAALMENTGEIVAVEAVRGRYYRLKSVLAQTGVTNVSLKFTDARRFRSPQLFDRILFDAPCSSEGRFKTDDPETYAYWSPRKIKEMVRKQRGLLLHASRLLKPGGVLVYSTCTFAPEENEGVIDWLMRKTQRELTVQPVSFEGVTSYPALLTWQKKSFNRQVENCLRVLPDGHREGFFIAKVEVH
ncbi:MAG: RsmB/NOP family class I SAM-dependent RNA methyltransferase [Candidatus Omnitrophica bacterium]|nr:RsmB/NOP family class I SAM-dependent RNA methyltransferase [Candidatus Omnitrophota bacterium]